MMALQGYYDGNSVKTLEKINAKKNQKVIITILDEFIDETHSSHNISARGTLAKYADTRLWNEEDSAWEEAVTEKYGNA